MLTTRPYLTFSDIFFQYQEARLTREHFNRCGYDSIQWAAVELNKNRIWNPERNLKYPLVSEDLWNKHLSSKRHLGTTFMNVKNAPGGKKKEQTNDGDDVCIRLARTYATKMDNVEKLNRIIEAAEHVIQTTGLVSIADTRFSLAGNTVEKK